MMLPDLALAVPQDGNRPDFPWDSSLVALAPAPECFKPTRAGGLDTLASSNK
jgi:hypothetical protein